MEIKWTDMLTIRRTAPGTSEPQLLLLKLLLFFFFFFFYNFKKPVASLLAQMVKNPPAMQETQVRCPGREDPLEKGTATHSSILA